MRRRRPPPPPRTRACRPRTPAADGAGAGAGAGEGAAGGDMTPRSAALMDQMMAEEMQRRLDDMASEAVAGASLAFAQAHAAKPKKAQPKTKAGKAAKKAAAAAAGASSGAAAKKAASSEVFHVDIGESKLQTTLDKKLLAKPLREALVSPALMGYLADKPGIAVMPEDLTVYVDGAVVDCTAPSKNYVNPDGETRVILILPPKAVRALAEQGVERGNALQPGGDTTPFHVNIFNGAAAGQPQGQVQQYQTATRLNPSWLAKPLTQALVEPALKAYFQSNPAAPMASAEDVKIVVNGEAADGKAVASSYVLPTATEGAPTVVELTLPLALEMQRKGPAAPSTTGPTLTVVRKGGKKAR